MPPPSLLPTPRLPALLLLPTLLQLLPPPLLPLPTPRLPLLPLPLLPTLPPVLPLPPPPPLYPLSLPLLSPLSWQLGLHASTATAAAMQRPSAPSGQAAASWHDWWGAAPVLHGINDLHVCQIQYHTVSTSYVTLCLVISTEDGRAAQDW